MLNSYPWMNIADKQQHGKKIENKGTANFTPKMEIKLTQSFNENKSFTWPANHEGSPSFMIDSLNTVLCNFCLPPNIVTNCASPLPCAVRLGSLQPRHLAGKTMRQSGTTGSWAYLTIACRQSVHGQRAICNETQLLMFDETIHPEEQTQFRLEIHWLHHWKQQGNLWKGQRKNEVLAGDAGGKFWARIYSGCDT